MRLRDDLSLRVQVAVEAAKAAAALHMRYRGHDLERMVHDGERSDFATKVDFEAQAMVREVIGRYFPHERVIGEEDEDWSAIEQSIEDGCWFTDPLDGTQDFVHGGPGFSCIVAYVEQGEPLACAICFPAWDETFLAGKGLGATLNGAPIRVSGQSQLEASIVSTAYRGSSPERAEAFARRVAKLLPRVESLRLPGAPGVMACAVAAGRYDLFANVGPLMDGPPKRPFPGQPWESAAFILLVREAGGVSASLHGGAADVLGHNVYAASRELIDAYLAVVRE
jgi:fructose-1,6-bisphosphatase/inositol monophosphatase family enzyme